MRALEEVDRYVMSIWGLERSEMLPIGAYRLKGRLSIINPLGKGNKTGNIRYGYIGTDERFRSIFFFDYPFGDRVHRIQILG
jgi:hypothetical protein